jgi:hypothetical protein
MEVLGKIRLHFKKLGDITPSLGASRHQDPFAARLTRKAPTKRMSAPGKVFHLSITRGCRSFDERSVGILRARMSAATGSQAISRSTPVVCPVESRNSLYPSQSSVYGSDSFENGQVLGMHSPSC